MLLGWLACYVQPQELSTTMINTTMNRKTIGFKLIVAIKIPGVVRPRISYVLRFNLCALLSLVPSGSLEEGTTQQFWGPSLH